MDTLITAVYENLRITRNMQYTDLIRDMVTVNYSAFSEKFCFDKLLPHLVYLCLHKSRCTS